jgi:hypothetical protein
MRGDTSMRIRKILLIPLVTGALAAVALVRLV